MTSGTFALVELGYARVSTAKQGLDRQIETLVDAGVARERIYVDKKSGATVDRPGLRAVLEYAREGDAIVVHTLDRLGFANDSTPEPPSLKTAPAPAVVMQRARVQGCFHARVWTSNRSAAWAGIRPIRCLGTTCTRASSRSEAA